jgi:dynein heavy chain
MQQRAETLGISVKPVREAQHNVINFVCLLLQVQAASDRFLSELGRHNYVTLTSYLQLLSSFKSMLEAKSTSNTTARKRYTVGLEKLASSASQVAGMQAELVAMQPQLVATVAEVEELMTRIAQEKKVSGC